MGDQDGVNRRSFIATAGAGATLAGGIVTPARGEPLPPLPAGFDQQQPLQDNWARQLGDLVEVERNLAVDAPELGHEAVRERHRLFCYLLMKLIVRFWNGNKRGPLGSYPQRRQQLDAAQAAGSPDRYRGDMIADPGPLRVNWDRYLGHNIACLAVDGNGEIIDFDFNHNDLFRSSAEHAESRMVRRLFSLADLADGWKTGRVQGKPRAASLVDVTLYTTLESCAQCSGVMSLAGVRQIVYMQNDFTAYKIGNLMYNLANRGRAVDAEGNPLSDWRGRPLGSLPGAPIPIAGSAIGLDEFRLLNDGNLAFIADITAAKAAGNPDGAFFVPPSGAPDFDPSITSFLCTDTAHRIFIDGGARLDTLTLSHPDWNFPDRPDSRTILSNRDCLERARAFYAYADLEGYRGSPHKL